MASTSGAADGEVDIAVLKEALFKACVEEAADEPKAVFHQNSIFELDIIPNRDVGILLQVAQVLVDEKFFKPVNDVTGLGWMLRSKEEAAKYRSLSTEQEIVYAIIDESGDDGIWTKAIKARSNLHDAVYRAAIKFLEGKNMIMDMKSVEHPARKMYIKTGARLSDRATGGPWFTDGVLDEEFVNSCMSVLMAYIKKKSFYRSSQQSPRKPKKTIKKMTPEEAKALRAQGLGARIKDEEEENERMSRNTSMARYLPMPAGYTNYPTLNELTQYIESTDFTPMTLVASEIQQLLDVMVFDDKIEKLVTGGQTVYKALRKDLDANMEVVTHGLVDAPCGRCPVFDICEEGGPVGPSNCEYYTDWLQL